MKWKNAVRDGLPDKTTDLVISHNGVYYTARYDYETQTFAITGETGKKVLSAHSELIYWIMTEEKKPVRDLLRVLIADDDIDDHAILKDALAQGRIPVEIDSVYDGEQVIDYLLRRNVYKNISTLPDLLLLDLNMPRMDGFEVLKEIRKHEQLKELPVFMITTSHDTDHHGKALDLGARGFYTKGSTREEMRRIIKEVCSECFEKI